MNTTTELPILNPVEARVLGCLIEKKETTPDVYPLTLNAAHAAANQKTARDPVMALESTEVHRTFEAAGAERIGPAVICFAGRRYEHQLAQRFSLTQPQITILGLLLLRGAQRRMNCLRASERMARFQSIEQFGANSTC